VKISVFFTFARSSPLSQKRDGNHSGCDGASRRIPGVIGAHPGAFMPGGRTAWWLSTLLESASHCPGKYLT
jgi:hypothetical protein